MNRASRMTRRTPDRRAARAAAVAVSLCALPVRAQTATTATTTTVTPTTLPPPALAGSPPGPVDTPAAGGEPSAHPDPSSKGQPSGGFVLSSPRASVILGGYAELFYQWNFNQPVNGVTNFRGFDTRHNSVTISNVVLDTAGSVGPVSVRIALQYGHTPETYYLSEPASPATAGAGATGTQVWKFLQQALIGYRAPLGRGLLFEGGIYLSPIGIEGMAIKDQWNFSRSNLFFGLPFYHTGFRVSYPLTARLTATLHAVNGWNSVVDNNTPWSLAGELAYVVPERLTLHFVYFTGIERSTSAPEGQPWRHLFDAYATLQPRAWIALSLHGALILSATNPKAGETVKSAEHENTFFRDAIGYSIGTLGIHRLGLFKLVMFFTFENWLEAGIGELRGRGLPTFHLDQLWPGVTDGALVSFIIYLVVFDFANYWLHRAQHRFNWWWALHSLHHSQRQMTMWSDNRNHLLDDLLRDSVFVLLALAVGVAPGQFVAIVAVTQLVESLSHANVRLGFGPFRAVLVSPSYHRLHHAVGLGHESAGQGTLGGHNFAVLFPVWDMIFGTACFDKAPGPTGIRDQLEGRDYGRGFWAQQWQAVLRVAGRA